MHCIYYRQKKWSHEEDEELRRVRSDYPGHKISKTAWSEVTAAVNLIGNLNRSVKAVKCRWSEQYRRWSDNGLLFGFESEQEEEPDYYPGFAVPGFARKKKKRKMPRSPVFAVKSFVTRKAAEPVKLELPSAGPFKIDDHLLVMCSSADPVFEEWSKTVLDLYTPKKLQSLQDKCEGLQKVNEAWEAKYKELQAASSKLQEENDMLTGRLPRIAQPPSST
jgi:hypothetical protein